MDVPPGNYPHGEIPTQPCTSEEENEDNDHPPGPPAPPYYEPDNENAPIREMFSDQLGELVWPIDNGDVEKLKQFYWEYDLFLKMYDQKGPVVFAQDLEYLLSDSPKKHKTIEKLITALAPRVLVVP